MRRSASESRFVCRAHSSPTRSASTSSTLSKQGDDAEYDDEILRQIEKRRRRKGRRRIRDEDGHSAALTIIRSAARELPRRRWMLSLDTKQASVSMLRGG